MVEIPAQQIPGVYHRRIGDIVVTALSDGYLDGTVDVLQNIDPDAAMRKQLLDRVATDRQLACRDASALPRLLPRRAAWR